MMINPKKRMLVPGLGVFTLTASAVGAQQESGKHLAPPAVYQVAPGLGQFTEEVLFEEVWERPQLAPRDRSLITMAALIAGGQPEQLPFHANRAMNSGLTSTEVAEVPARVAFYAGWPRAMSSVPVLEKVFASRSASGTAPEARTHWHTHPLGQTLYGSSENR